MKISKNEGIITELKMTGERVISSGDIKVNNKDEMTT